MIAKNAPAFFSFMKEREQVRLRKEADLPFPWTDDVILQTYKFTNIRRHHDRTSRELIRRFYAPNFHEDELSILMNAALFRYFGTWEFAEAVGWQTYNTFDFKGIKDCASNRLRRGMRVFTGAYIITNQGMSEPKEQIVCDYFLFELHRLAPRLIDLLHETKSWEKVGRRMMQINGFGGSGFMTKEILLDTTYTGFWGKEFTEDGMSFSRPVDWDTWTPVGPGARRGADRIVRDVTGTPDSNFSESKAFAVIMDLVEMSQYPEFWPPEYGPMAPHDIQFQLCEFDKYERVRTGQGKPRSKYRQKQ